LGGLDLFAVGPDVQVAGAVLGVGAADFDLHGLPLAEIEGDVSVVCPVAQGDGDRLLEGVGVEGKLDRVFSRVSGKLVNFLSIVPRATIDWSSGEGDPCPIKLFPSGSVLLEAILGCFRLTSNIHPWVGLRSEG
jgi:hypothetical protein